MDSATVGLFLLTIISWGLWGFFHKIGVSKIGAKSTLFVDSIVVLVVVIGYLALVQKLHIPRSESLIYPILGGVSSAIGAIAFFTALETMPVSIVRPMAGLAAVITALLGLLVLGETLTVNQYVGIGLAVAAIVLLAT